MCNDRIITLLVCASYFIASNLAFLAMLCDTTNGPYKHFSSAKLTQYRASQQRAREGHCRRKGLPSLIPVWLLLPPMLQSPAVFRRLQGHSLSSRFSLRSNLTADHLWHIKIQTTCRHFLQINSSLLTFLSCLAIQQASPTHQLWLTRSVEFISLQQPACS